MFMDDAPEVYTLLECALHADGEGEVLLLHQLEFLHVQCEVVLLLVEGFHLPQGLLEAILEALNLGAEHGYLILEVVYLTL
jgi:hypothetical protein